MPNTDPTSRQMIARLGAYGKWSNTTDRTAATDAMRRGFEERFLRLAREAAVKENPNASERDIALRAEALRKEHYQRMAIKSRQVRAAKRKGKQA